MSSMEERCWPATQAAFIRTVVRAASRWVLEAEMTEAVGAAKGERAPCSGYGPLGLALGQTRGVER